MNSVTHRYRGQRAPSPSQCEPKVQACSRCGRLECLCRPRFFAGQVLTADDLNRLDYYVRAKNRLHNRQLHGWGVVNGLEVSCDVCGPGVVVGCGYALGPCGDDIVVCEPVVVDVCTLIADCVTLDRARNCDPPAYPAPNGCSEAEQEWVLAIRYSETPTRAVQPLASPAGQAGCGCSCGGAGGTCTCGGTSAKAKPRNAPVQCEPTVVCEGYDFAVYRKPADTQDDDQRSVLLNPDSELYKRFDCCTQPLIRDLPKTPGALTVAAVQQDPVSWNNWLHAFRNHLLNYLATRPGQNCELQGRLNAVVLPSPNSTTFVQEVIATALRLAMIWLDMVLGCLCSALLPPCPSAHPSDLVPLASVRVSAGNCRVLSICNWTTHRKIATTFPALQYWLSLLPFGRMIRDMLDDLCCSSVSDSAAPQQDPAGTADTGGNFGTFEPPDFMVGMATTYPYMHAKATRRLNPSLARPNKMNHTSAMAASALKRGASALDPLAFVESVLLPARDRGDQHLSALELANLPQFLALNQMLRPMALQTLGGDGFASMLAPLLMQAARVPAAKAPAADSAGIDELKKEMAGLREAVTRQAEEIRTLKTHGRSGKGK